MLFLLIWWSSSCLLSASGKGSFPKSCISTFQSLSQSCLHSHRNATRLIRFTTADTLLICAILGFLWLPFILFPFCSLSFILILPKLYTMAPSFRTEACRFASILVWLVTQYVVCVPRPTQVTTWAASLVSLMTGLPDVPTVSEVGNLLPFFFWKKESVPTTLGMGDSLLTFLWSVMLVPSR